MGRRMYQDEWVAVGDVWLHYQDWPWRDRPGPDRPAPDRDRDRPGPGAGPAATPDRAPVLMLHGLTQQSHVFDAAATRLGRGRRCVALDLRGRGESGWAPPSTYTVPRYVEDVRRVLDALGIGAAHVIGTSLGGLIGLSLAAVAPARLRSLVLNDIGPEIDPRGAARIAQYTATVPARFPDFDAAAGWARAQYPWLAGLAPDALGEAVRWAVRREPDGTWRLKLDPAVGRSARAAPAVAAAARAAWWSALEGLRCPVLLVRGAESDVLSDETARAMQRRQPALRRVDVPGVGHAPTLAEPAVLEALAVLYGDEGGSACASS
jgi:pimeloyl-ACP methyl ester carboxylesterase